LKGGLLGGFLAGLFFAGASALSAWWTNTVGGEEIGALFGAFSLGLRGYAAILAVAIAIAVLTGAMSRIIVFRHLRRLQ
jgi:cell division transport system permease protein